MAIIYHLITERDWATAQEAGLFRPGSFSDEGFVHCSQDEEQMLRVAQRLYAGRDDLLALEVDTERQNYRVVWEPSRSGEIYPHIYGPLDTAAVVQARRLIMDGEGNFLVDEV